MKLLAFLTFLALPALAADDYQLKMHRPSKPGEKFLEEGKASFESTMVLKINRQQVKVDEMKCSVTFTAESEALVVNKFGKTTKVRVKLQSIAGEFNGKPMTQLSAGDELILETAKPPARKSLQINGQPASDEQAKIADVFLTVAPEDSEANDDEIFGTTKRIKPGDEWPVNAAKAIEDAGRWGIPKLKQEDLGGKTKFIDVEQAGSLSCLHLAAEMNLHGSGMPFPGMPEGVTVQQLNVRAGFEGNFPVDPTITYNPASKLMMVMSMKAGGVVKQRGKDLEIDVSAETKGARQVTVKPLK